MVSVAYEVGSVCLHERCAFKLKRDLWTVDGGDLAMLEFQSETLLIHRFEKAATHLAVDFENCALDLVALVGKYDVRSRMIGVVAGLLRHDDFSLICCSVPGVSGVICEKYTSSS